jgi:hypothetical protein
LKTKEWNPKTEPENTQEYDIFTTKSGFSQVPNPGRHPPRTPLGPAALVKRGEKFINGNRVRPSPQTPNSFHCFIGPGLAPLTFRHNPRDSAPAPRNNKRLAALYRIEQSRQMSFCFGGLNLAHKSHPKRSFRALKNIKNKIQRNEPQK